MNKFMRESREAMDQMVRKHRKARDEDFTKHSRDALQRSQDNIRKMQTWARTGRWTKF
jgi:hypothetical protein